jgi:hypothetical protein
MLEARGPTETPCWSKLRNSPRMEIVPLGPRGGPNIIPLVGNPSMIRSPRSAGDDPMSGSQLHAFSIHKPVVVGVLGRACPLSFLSRVRARVSGPALR